MSSCSTSGLPPADGPCYREFEGLRIIASRYPQDQFAIIGVSSDEDVQELRKCAAAERLDWPHICDGGGWRDPLQKLFSITFIPMTYVLAREGIIASKYLGGDELAKMLDELILGDGDAKKDGQ